MTTVDSSLRQVFPYQDPLDQIWIFAMKELGFHVERKSTAYASYDGKGTITIAPSSDLDADDCLAQLLFHELCHHLVEGETSRFKPDWGIPDLLPEEGITHEHACQRLQAALLKPYGLDGLFAPTTEFRTYYDQLPENPLADTNKDGTFSLAQSGLFLSQTAFYKSTIHRALEKTATIYRILQENLPKNQTTQSLWNAKPITFHQSGFPLSTTNTITTCKDCVWSQTKGTQTVCLQSQSVNQKANISLSDPVCILFEKHLNCQSCAACCRPAYPIVPIRKKELSSFKHTNFVNQQSKTWSMKRSPSTGNCIALHEISTSTYACSIYDQRPKTCQDLAPASSACLIARKKMGISL